MSQTSAKPWLVSGSPGIQDAGGMDGCQTYESLTPALLLLPPAECDPRACWCLPLVWCDLGRGWQPQEALRLPPAGTHSPGGRVPRRLSCGIRTYSLWHPENDTGHPRPDGGTLKLGSWSPPQIWKRLILFLPVLGQSRLCHRFPTT